MKNNLLTGIIIGGLILFNGCSNRTYSIQLPKVDINETMKYENKYLNEYNNSRKRDNIIKWIQAANKKVSCKLFVGTDFVNDRTKDPDYKIYWDGKCKNGYAYGLGRELERGTLTNMNAIAIYSGKKEEPQYFRQKYNLQNILIEGDLTNNYYVKRIIVDNTQKFDVIYQYGYFKIPEMFIEKSLFNDNVAFFKRYPNFHYRIIDFSNNEFDNRIFNFSIIEVKNGINGYSVEMTKNNVINAGLIKYNKLIKRVVVPKSYLQHIQDIWNEIKNAAQKALNSQQKAQLVINRYKTRICKKNVKVSFIDNDEYKKICQEDEENRKLQQRINKKLEQINREKYVKRQQLQQQRIQQMKIQMMLEQQKRAQEEANRRAIMNGLNQLNNTLYRQQQQQLMNNMNFWLMTH